MHESIKFIHRSHNASEHGIWDQAFSTQEAETARQFHKSIPGYQPTPLVTLQNLADRLGLSGLYVKDESYRFGLNAFKGLGGSYCIARCIADMPDLDVRDLTFARLTELDVRDKIRGLTLVTATDGNHGRGIAWTAHLLGIRAVVFMPHGSSAERLQNIRKLGAEASITDYNYDDTVRYAGKMADEHGWILVQDTAWPGYEKIPSRIMQGYLTMVLEAFEQMPKAPTHIFLQAGVGAMSGAAAAFAADYYGDQKPVITIVEPNGADCIFRTAYADDGKLHKVTGDLHTIMAGLACGEPCTVGWEELKAHADNFVSVPDYVAAKGMRILGNPLDGDPRVISGESGASTVGFAAELMQNESLDYIREQLQIGGDSRVLCFSTEGDTDRENYRRIVWDGAFPSF